MHAGIANEILYAGAVRARDWARAALRRSIRRRRKAASVLGESESSRPGPAVVCSRLDHRRARLAENLNLTIFKLARVRSRLAIDAILISAGPRAGSGRRTVHVQVSVKFKSDSRFLCRDAIGSGLFQMSHLGLAPGRCFGSLWPGPGPKYGCGPQQKAGHM